LIAANQHNRRMISEESSDAEDKKIKLKIKLCIKGINYFLKYI